MASVDLLHWFSVFNELVRVCDNGNEKVKHADDDNKDLDKPKEPDQGYIEVRVELEAEVIHVAPVVVTWRLKVSKGASQDTKSIDVDLIKLRVVVMLRVVLRIMVASVIECGSNHKKGHAEVDLEQEKDNKECGNI